MVKEEDVYKELNAPADAIEAMAQRIEVDVKMEQIKQEEAEKQKAAKSPDDSTPPIDDVSGDEDGDEDGDDDGEGESE